MGWIIAGAVAGFFLGGALGTLLAPKRGIDGLLDLQERLRGARDAALSAAERAGHAVEERFVETRGRPFRRRRGRRR